MSESRDYYYAQEGGRVWFIVESCGCMTVIEMNETYEEAWGFCPFCGKKLVVE